MRKIAADTGSPSMKGGNDAHSYVKNSDYQRECADLEKKRIVQVIEGKLDVKEICSASNAIYIADLGCSVGPNTFIALQNIVEAIKQKHQTQCPKSTMPEFQVFFNDQSSNDFNTLFNSLPKDRQYFATGAPGSFHGRLFSESSIHFAYASHALHWLSTVPEEVLNKDSSSWNKGRIHYTNAPEEVGNAFRAQFFKDMVNFLNARAKEIVAGGVMVIITPAIRHGLPHSKISFGVTYGCMESILIDMAKEGLISEDQVDSFNLPLYIPTREELTEVIERNGCFSIELMESTNPSVIIKGEVNMQEMVAHLRAAMEVLFSNHFQSENTVNDIFDRVTRRAVGLSDKLRSTLDETLQLFVALKRC